MRLAQVQALMAVSVTAAGHTPARKEEARGAVCAVRKAKK